MKTAVSIPDELFERADELARMTGKSRSELYRQALAEYVARREPGAVTAQLNQLADDLASDRDEFTSEAARSTLTNSEW